MGTLSGYPTDTVADTKFVAGVDALGNVKLFQLSGFGLPAVTRQWGAMQSFLSANAIASAVANFEIRAVTGATDGAWMFLHRPGVVATFFGLDTDGKVKIGGSSWSVDRWTLDSSGNMATAGNITVGGAGIFFNVPSPPTVAADTIALIPQRLNASGGGVMPRFRTEDAINWTMQSHFGRNSLVWVQVIGGVATAPAFNNISNLTSIGTLTTRAFAGTSRLTRAKRLGHVSAATAGAAASPFYNSGAGSVSYSVGGAAGSGFRAIFRFAVTDASLVAGAHAIIGMRNATAVPTVTANPNTLTNIVALAQTNGSTNWQIVYGGSAAQTAIDTGMAVNNTDLLELIIYARPDVNNKVTWRLENISTGAVASGELTAATPGTQLPANTTFLGPIMWRSNNATAAAVGLDLVGMTIESDI